jgi:glycosyltransferase involved in cell wall biosynthesis
LGLPDVTRGNQHHKRFTVVGTFNGNWSIAAVNRRLALLLEEHDPGCCSLACQDGPIRDVPTKDFAYLAAIAARPLPEDGRHIVIHQGWPVMPPALRGDITLAYFFWEETLVPANFIETLQTYDGILVPAESIRQALMHSGMARPIYNVGYSPDLAPFLQPGKRPPKPAGHEPPFTFLHVSAGDKRKGIDVLLQAYARVFRRSDPVRLVIRGPRPPIMPYIDAVMDSDPDIAEIMLLDKALDLPTLSALYHYCDAMILPTRGEGFNIPAAEAIAAGLKLVVTGYGGHTQFCRAGVARLVNYRMAPASVFPDHPNSEWAEPDLDDLCSGMAQARAGSLHTDSTVRDAVLQYLDGKTWMRRLMDAIDCHERLR